MKKIYAFATMLGVVTCVNAQNVIDFETYPLGTESFDNGLNAPGYFMFNDVYLSNVYDTAWGSWTGFSISNITDTITSGWVNQYSSFPGHGSNNSNNYAVFHDNGFLTFSPNQSRVFDSVKITNTTYAAISMRDGDGYGKKFGSQTNASGVIDGTNGEDFFKVWIICEDYNGIVQDSIEFYLADYRFADNTQDYIVDEWTNIDLAGFGFYVNKISFRFESSDVSFGYINTPAYFAVDDISYQYLMGTADLKEENVNIYPNPVNGALSIEGGAGLLTLHSLTGRVVVSQQHSGVSVLDVSNLNSGVYILRIFSENRSYMERIVLN
jgi:hypothetical protein